MKLAALDEVRNVKGTTAVRLLVLEQEAGAGEQALAELRARGYDVQCTLARQREPFVAALQAGGFDAVVLGCSAEGWPALEVLQEARNHAKGIPVLVVAARLGEEAAAECIKQGASEYIQSGHPERLPAALRRALEEKQQRDESARRLRELAESEARAQEQLAELDMIYRTAPIGLAVYGPDLRYLRVNEQLARMSGLAADRHAGLMTRDVNPDIGKAIEPYLRRVFAKGESILNVEVRGTTRAQAGVERSWVASFHPLRGEAGVISAISVVVQENTERKQSEEALRRSETRNREMSEHAAYGIFRIAKDGTFLDANPALLRMVGCGSTEELKAPALVADAFRYPTDYAKCLAACGEEGEVHEAEVEWRRRDGAMATVRLRMRRLADSATAGAFEVIAEDVTEVKAMQQQLLHAQKFEAVGQLAGGVAHDFNNVIGAILGWAELGLEQSRANPQTAERFARIREQAERAAGLTRELLAFARRQVLQPRTVELNTVTSNLVSLLDRVLPKSIQLKVVNAPVDAVKADPTQIEQVLMNLCLNARDAMPEGGRLLIETEMAEIDEAYCRFYPYVAPGRYAVLCVSDTGVGMSAETRERIFEPFFTTKGKHKNSGMGLATAYGVVKQHGGFIHVYSEPGQGSLFRVYLPVLNGSDTGEAAASQRRTARVEARGTETLLIAEDHDSIREMSRQALANLGYRVLSAVDGEEALRLCESEKPALAILDLVMPKLSGADTAARLVERFGGLPVLFTSGYSQEARGTQSTEYSARFLQKPYSPSNLTRMVREILDEEKKGKEGT